MPVSYTTAFFPPCPLYPPFPHRPAHSSSCLFTCLRVELYLGLALSHSAGMVRSVFTSLDLLSLCFILSDQSPAFLYGDRRKWINCSVSEMSLVIIRLLQHKRPANSVIAMHNLGYCMLVPRSCARYISIYIYFMNVQERVTGALAHTGCRGKT